MVDSKQERTIPFSKTAIAALTPPSEGAVEYKTPQQGLLLRISRSGVRSWLFRGRVKGGKMVARSLGKFPAITPQEAQRLALEQQRLCALGINPIAHDRELRAQEAAKRAAARTVAEFIEDYLPQATRGLKAPGAVERVFRGPITATWGQVPMNKLDVAAVVKGVHQIRKSNGEEAARKSALYLRKMAGDLFAQGDLPDNRLEGLDLRVFRFARPKRGRVATKAELKELLEAVRCSNLSPATAIGIQLQLLLVTRVGELLQAQWSEFDLMRGVWHVPAEHTKTSKPHSVPLPTQAVSLLQQLYAHTAESGRVLGGLNDKSMTKALGRLQGGKDNPNKLTVHDLRRSAATWIAASGASGDVVRAILSHSGGVTSIYNRSTLLPQVREALQAWADGLDDLNLLPDETEVLPFHGIVA